MPSLQDQLKKAEMKLFDEVGLFSVCMSGLHYYKSGRFGLQMGYKVSIFRGKKSIFVQHMNSLSYATSLYELFLENVRWVKSMSFEDLPKHINSNWVARELVAVRLQHG